MSRRVPSLVQLPSTSLASLAATVGLLATPCALAACGDAFSGSDNAGGQSATTTTTPSTTTPSSTTSSSQGGSGQGGSQGGAAAAGGVPPTGGAGGAVPCGTECTSQGFTCCPTGCKNTDNDIFNCGGCGHPCLAVHPYCDQGSCAATPPCNEADCIATTFCCGQNCCELDQLCCSVPEALDLGPACYTPEPPFFTCPVGCPQCQCASPDTPIATADGERAIASVRVGDYVWSRDRGRPLLVPVLAVNRTRVHDHEVVRVTFSDATSFAMSAAHPTDDGRTMGVLVVGDWLGSKQISTLERQPYPFDYTYDILPGSDSGSYLASGAWVGSTLVGLRSTATGR